MRDSNYREDVFTTSFRAGKRTYFFDVKSTKGNDLFMTITESKKHTAEDGSASFEKHKIFLYKEDFDKFIDYLNEAVSQIRKLQESGEYRAAEDSRRPYLSKATDENHSSVSFDDL
jgi:hypothetical protein